MKIDRVYYNGVIRTMVSEGDTVEALAVQVTYNFLRTLTAG